MQTSRHYHPTPITVGETLTLTPDKSHHLAVVLRCGLGEETTLFNGDGSDYHARITQVHKKALQVAVQSATVIDRESPLQLHLGQGLCRGEKMDWVIQKAVELGVTVITPLLTEHSNVKLDAERLAQKQQHWQQVLISACEQSGRSRLPVLNAPCSLTQWLPLQTAARRFVLHPHQATPIVAEPIPASVAFLIGPEGGLSPAEVTLARTQHFQPACLGPRILRTETAPIAALSLAQALWGDFLIPRTGII